MSEDKNKTLLIVKQALDNALLQKKFSQEVFKNLGPAVIDVLQPILERIADNSKLTKGELVNVLSQIKIEIPKIEMPDINVKVPDITVPTPQVTVQVPEVKIPEIKVPQTIIPPIKVPTPEVTVNVPPFPKIPDLKWPEQTMPIEGWVRLQGVSLENPLPVQLRDSKGNPLKLFENLTQIVSSGGGGGFQYITVKDIQKSGISIISDAESAVRVIGNVAVSGVTGSVGATILNGDGNSLDPRDRNWTITETVPISVGSTMDVKQVSGSIDSVNIMQILGSPVVVGSGYQANALRVVQATDSVSSVVVNNAFAAVGGSGEANSNALRVITATDAVASVYANNPVNQGDAATALRVVIAGNSDVSVTATQTGTWNIGTVTTVTGVTNSVQATIIDSTGIGYSGSNPVPITWVSGAGVSTQVNISDSTGVGYSGSNPVPVTFVTGVSASVNASLIDSGGIGYSGSNPIPITWVSGAGATVGAANIDSSGVQYSGSNPFPITIVTSATASVNASLIDSGGVGYSGSNPVPITGNVNVNGALNSVLAIGVTLHDAVDEGDAPLKIGGVATQTNPTAVANGDRVRFIADDLGRQLNRPIQVRDLIRTAYATLSNGTETTLFAATAGEYHDLIYIMGANTSGAAIQVDIRGVTAGNIVFTLELPASGTAGVSLPVPIPQSDTGNNWTADMGDFTNTTVYVSGLFSKEV